MTINEDEFDRFRKQYQELEEGVNKEKELWNKIKNQDSQGQFETV